jgi:hypothetical protein
VALRPHLIWGPGDNHLVPRLLERGRAGRLRRIGTGKQNRPQRLYRQRGTSSRTGGESTGAGGGVCG